MEDVTFQPGRDTETSKGGGIFFCDGEGNRILEFHATHFTIRGVSHPLATLEVENAKQIICEIRDWFKAMGMNK